MKILPVIGILIVVLLMITDIESAIIIVIGLATLAVLLFVLEKLIGRKPD